MLACSAHPCSLVAQEPQKAKAFFKTIASIPGYKVIWESGRAGKDIIFHNKLVARYFRKHDLFGFLKENGITWQEILPTLALHDSAILVIERMTLYFIVPGKKFSHGMEWGGLLNCDFVKKQYIKLLRGLSLRVEYLFVLNDQFRHPRFKEVLDYIHSANCDYMFNVLPLSWLGLPVGQP